MTYAYEPSARTQHEQEEDNQGRSSQVPAKQCDEHGLLGPVRTESDHPRRHEGKPPDDHRDRQPLSADKKRRPGVGLGRQVQSRRRRVRAGLGEKWRAAADQAGFVDQRSLWCGRFLRAGIPLGLGANLFKILAGRQFLVLRQQLAPPASQGLSAGAQQRHARARQVEDMPGFQTQLVKAVLCGGKRVHGGRSAFASSFRQVTAESQLGCGPVQIERGWNPRAGLQVALRERCLPAVRHRHVPDDRAVGHAFQARAGQVGLGHGVGFRVPPAEAHHP